MKCGPERKFGPKNSQLFLVIIVIMKASEDQYLSVDISSMIFFQLNTKKLTNNFASLSELNLIFKSMSMKILQMHFCYTFCFDEQI